MIKPCRKCGRNCEVRPADEIFCDECIYEFKQAFMEKHSLKKGQTVYTLITGSKKDAFTVRQYKIHKIEFRNWFYSYEDASNLDFNSMDNRFSIVLKSTINSSTLERNLNEIFNTEEDCFNANKEKISAHMFNATKKQFLKAIEQQIDTGLEISLDNDYIKQLIDKTIQETNFEQQKILSIEKPLPEDEVYKNCVSLINKCKKAHTRILKTELKISDVFGFDNPGFKLFDGIIEDLEDISTKVLKHNQTLFIIYINNVDSFHDWFWESGTSFESWLDEHKEDNQ
jgi:hypothetical protein